MSAETITPPLFLSPGGYTEALGIHAAFMRRDTDAMRRAVERAVRRLSEEDWARYDDTYLALYALSLSGDGKPVQLTSPKGLGDLPNRGSVMFMLDIDLRNDSNAHHLLDERAVAVFINFKHAMEGWIPFRIAPRMLGFGCIIVEFEVMVPDLSGLRSPEGAAGQAFVPGGLITSLFTGSDWDDLRSRFNVIDVAVSRLG